MYRLRLHMVRGKLRTIISEPQYITRLARATLEVNSLTFAVRLLSFIWTYLPLPVSDRKEMGL